MNTRVQYWHSALQDYLRESYLYHPETGHVVRRHKNRGPIGSVTKNYDLLMGATFEGKQYMIRVVKLAYFLQTGKQYHKFDWKDGDKLNNRFDNIVPIGREVMEELNYPTSIEDRTSEYVRRQFQERMQLREEYLQDIAQKKKVWEDERRYTRKVIAVKNPEFLESKKRMDEQAKRNVELEAAQAARPPEKWREGLPTYTTVKIAQAFMEDCNTFSSEPLSFSELITRFIQEKGKGDMKAQLNEYDEKWRADRFWCAYCLTHLEEYGEQSITSLLNQYKWRQPAVTA